MQLLVACTNFIKLPYKLITKEKNRYKIADLKPHHRMMLHLAWTISLCNKKNQQNKRVQYLCTSSDE